MEEQLLTAYLCFWLAVLGAVLGSFLDCAASRWAAGTSKETGRSTPLRSSFKPVAPVHEEGGGDPVEVQAEGEAALEVLVDELDGPLELVVGQGIL